MKLAENRSERSHAHGRRHPTDDDARARYLFERASELATKLMMEDEDLLGALVGGPLALGWCTEDSDIDLVLHHPSPSAPRSLDFEDVSASVTFLREASFNAPRSLDLECSRELGRAITGRLLVARGRTTSDLLARLATMPPDRRLAVSLVDRGLTEHGRASESADGTLALLHLRRSVMAAALAQLQLTPIRFVKAKWMLRALEHYARAHQATVLNIYGIDDPAGFATAATVRRTQALLMELTRKMPGGSRLQRAANYLAADAVYEASGLGASGDWVSAAFVVRESLGLVLDVYMRTVADGLSLLDSDQLADALGCAPTGNSSVSRNDLAIAWDCLQDTARVILEDRV